MTNRSKGIVLSYLTVLVKNLSLLLYTQILLKFLGKSEYGLYQIANSVISNLTLLNLGFSFAYIKFYTGFAVKNEEKNPKTEWNLFAFFRHYFLVGWGDRWNTCS